jgi:2-polyprenyl-3-methyl-5-hydroxy-6-metoxy-1,4-benzoquinol methylase
VSYKEHYKNQLARHYTWMFGDFDSQVAAQKALFERYKIQPESSGVALDLGCGSGFQSVALSQLGFDVRAVDTSEELLAELRQRNAGVQTSCRDIRDLLFAQEFDAELVVCMGDTLTHLESIGEVQSLVNQTHALLRGEGTIIFTFRDLHIAIEGLDRFILVRSDQDRILSCFLEDGLHKVTVTDLLYERDGVGFALRKSSYQKLKLALSQLKEITERAGFEVETETLPGGMCSLLGRKR